MPIVAQGSLSIVHGGITAAAAATIETELDTSGVKTALTQVLSTTAANINTGAVTWSNGTWLLITNMSSNTAEIVTVLKSAVEIGIIPAGQSYGPIKIKADGTALQAKSATGTPTIQVVIAGPLTP